MLQIMAKAKYKPLSFSTTMRNPSRIVSFLNCIVPYEHKILTSDIIMEIIYDVIRKKLYKPTYISKNLVYKGIYSNDENEFDLKQIKDIVRKSPQKHKEAGFEYGWPSRFDTWFKLSKEFGFLYYEMNEPIIISKVGHMLIDAINEQPINNEKIENVFCNSLAKYASNNPFRKTLNSNVPLLLLLKVIKNLKEDDECDHNGIYRREIPIFLCWPNGDDKELYAYIKNLRKKYRYTYSDEFIYDRCLELLQAGEKDKKYFKMSKICKESVDEYIRKMRMTGLLSLRGNGRFLDINRFKIEKVNYITSMYPTESIYTDKKEYFNYIGEVDLNIINIHTSLPDNSDEIRKNTIIKYANEYSKESILSELLLLGTSHKESKDPVFRFINAPARLEFLTSVALKQCFKDLDVNPQYPYDDEGLPTSTAGGGIADIICKEPIYDELIEVTLMRGRSDQVNNEIIPIARHQKEARKLNPNTFSILIAPIIHDDTREAAEWQKFKNNLDIITYDIPNFISYLDNCTDSFLSKLLPMNMAFG